MEKVPKNETDGRVQDLKGLSGGERSYATVAFVLALWESMDSPFRQVQPIFCKSQKELLSGVSLPVTV